jgi:flagellar motor switch protein FliM
LTGPFGAQEWFWLLPREGLLSLLEQSGAPATADAGIPKPQLQERVQDLPIEVTVVLGSVDVRLSQLSNLRVGDVIVLNQRVSETMTASLGGEKKIRGWPGRMGASQAFQIDSFLNR